MKKLMKIANHLRKYLLAYVFFVIIIALPIGYYNTHYFETHRNIIKNAILFLAIGTLLPSMIQLRAKELGKEIRLKWKETIIALTIIFLVAPATAIFFANHISSKTIGIGYVAANSVPASSASVAYVMLAEGNIELATLLVFLSVIIALFASPLYVGLYAQSVHVSLPIIVLAKSVTIALLIPLILGQLIRYYFITMKARKIIMNSEEKKILQYQREIRKTTIKEEKVLERLENNISKQLKPILSIWTIVFMLILISLLIANKANLLISKPELAAYIIFAQLCVYTIIILSVLIASILMKIRYKDHMAMAFISLTKNESVAAAMAVIAIGSTAAIPAALIPAIQPIVAILYISASPTIKKILRRYG